MAVTDTRIDDPRNPDFKATGELIAYRDGQDLHWSKLYEPSAAALGWDQPLVSWGSARTVRNASITKGARVMALGSHHGGFSYVVVRSTGRTKTRVELSGGAEGMRAQLFFCDDLKGEMVKAWTMKEEK